MLKCPKCNSEIVYEDSYLVTVQYKIVGNKKGKTILKQTKPSVNNYVNSKLKCLGCGGQFGCTISSSGEILSIW